jgi:Ser/Thr protein kinase RdoA (MazF antagonist)
MRLKHGYTNGTSTNGRTVTKHYLGPDTDQRHRNEVTALSRLAGLVPVPPLVQDLPDGVVTGFVAGTHGQELLDQGYAEQVLRLCGQLARQVHAVDPALLPELGTPGEGETLVHGDFGPQNLLIDTDRWQPAALLDWELVRFDDPVQDLAWPEWIIRTHHPHLVSHLDALFDGYGTRPEWPRRQAAMLRTCHWAMDFVRRWDSGEEGAERMWIERIRHTEQFRE